MFDGIVNKSMASGGGAIDDFTNANGQQAIWIIGDSLFRTSESLEAGPEPFRTGIVYRTNSTGGTISEVTTADIEGVTNGSCWPKFGVDYYKRTQRKCVFVNSAVGGSEVHNNGTPSDNWSTSGSLYTSAKTKLANAMTTLGVTKPKMIFISLGINDVRNVTTTTGQIETGFESLFSRIDADYPGIPVYIGQLGLEGDGTNVSAKNTDTRAIIVTESGLYSQMYILADFMDYVGTANSTLYQTDFLHLTQMGNDLLGATMVKDLLALGAIDNNPISYTFSAISAVDTVLGFSNFLGLNDEEKKAMYDYIGYLDAKGDWTKYDSVYTFLLNTQTKADQDLRRSAKQIAGGGASWTNKVGYVTDGSGTGVVRTNFIPSTDATAGGFQSNNNIAGLFIKDRTSGTGSKRTSMGVVGNVANRHHYMSETDGLGEFIQVNNCGTESTGTPSVGSALLFDGNRIWLNRRSGIGAHALGRFPAIGYVSGVVNSVGHVNLEFIIGGKNNNGTYDEFMALTSYGCYFMIGGSTEYIRGARKFREFCIDLLLWA